jgi:hypothetical protein
MKVVLEALKERETIQELAVNTRYTRIKVPPGRSSFWIMPMWFFAKIQAMRNWNKPVVSSTIS